MWLGKTLAVVSGMRWRKWNKWEDLPATEAEAGAGEIFIGEEAIVGYELIRDLPIEALTQGLDREKQYIRNVIHIAWLDYSNSVKVNRSVTNE